MIWFMYILQNNHHNNFSYHPSLHIVTNFFLVQRTFKIFLNNFQIYSTIFLTLVTMLYVRSPALIPLTIGCLHLWPPLPISPTLHSPPLATTVYSLYLWVIHSLLSCIVPDKKFDVILIFVSSLMILRSSVFF